MSTLTRNAPYYDRYDREKKYSQLLAVPGRVAQAREITELQSTMKDIIRGLGDSIMNDGNIIEGCQVIPDKDKKIVTVTAGRVYMQGMVLNLPESKIDISAQGTEIIGVRLKESIVYAINDPELRDPALGFDNYNQPGCDRLKSELEVLIITDEDVANNSSAILGTLIDGEVAVEQQAPNYSSLNETLARRTYDESGSYIVEGLNVRVEPNMGDTNMYNLVVESGKAYVYGYELTVPAARNLSVPRATTTTGVTARYNYSEGSKYLLTTGPYVRSINKVTGTLQSIESVTINNSSGAALSYSTAYNIIKVEKDGVTLNPSTYRLEQGPTSYIRWNDTTYPGDNVVVTYYYTHEFREGDNYELYTDSSNNSQYLAWVDSSPLKPVVGESLIIEYSKYLARKDTVYMDQYGNIAVIQGIPADYGTELAPSAPVYTLPLAYIMSPPGGSVTLDEDLKIVVSNVGLTRFTMSDIHGILKRIRTIEYDQTVLSLNTEAKEYGTDDKRGIFTDPFIDLSKLGLEFNLLNGEPIRDDRPIFDVNIDLESNMIHLPLLNSFSDTIYDETKSTVNRYDRVVSLRKIGEREVLSQMKATKSFLVSPYLSYPQTPEVFITPSLDTWYDDTYVEVPVSINTSKIVSSSTRNVSTSSGSGNRSATSTSTSVQDSSVGVLVDKLVEEDVISESAVTYIRPREISVSGNHYPSNLDNIKCYFEGVKADLTPTGNTVRGTEDGSVKADSNGKFTATFQIPKNVLTGTRVVSLESDIKIDGYQSSAITFYQAIGIARTIKRTITTITTVLLNRVTTIHSHTTRWWEEPYDPDPLAQTFILDSMTLLSGVDIYFESVPSDDRISVTCEIREVLNGSITGTVYGFKTMRASEIRPNISADSSKATRFRFNDPVLIEPNKEYAFVLKSSSQDYRVFVAEIGETDILSNEMVSSNPYLLGIMMSSSNNRSWNNHQKTDVKFRLIADEYDTTSEVHFSNIYSSLGFCRMNLSAESIIFDNTSINWYYSLDGGISYQDITPYNIKVIDQLRNDVLLKARLTRNSANTNLSPVLALDSVGLSLACYDNETDGYYVSNMISGLDEYSTVELILDNHEPSGTNIKVFVSPSNNNDTPYIMKEATLVKSTERNYGWFEKTYKVTLDEPSTICRIFVKLESNSKYHTPSFRKLRAIMS